MNIAEIRKKYPQYNDLSDQQLADGLHAKYYSDIPKDQFYEKIGVSSEMPWGDKRKSETLDAMFGGRAAPKAPDTTWQKVRPYVNPTIETAGLLGGGVIGAAAGPVTGIAGAGLGYAGGKKVTGLLDHYLGDAPLPQGVAENAYATAGDIASGAAMEMGGGVVGAAIPPLVKGTANVLGVLRGGASFARQRAAKIVQQALEHVPQGQVTNALVNASPGTTGGQALGNLTAPTYQALAREALKRDPEFKMMTAAEQDILIKDTLEALIGGGQPAATATQARTTLNAMHKDINAELVPTLKTELAAANIAGNKLPGLESQAARMSDAASNKVTDVGRFTDLGNKATEASKTWRPSMMGGKGPTLPLPLRKYTYPAELAQRAEAMAQQSADASLLFGESKRFAQYAADSLKAHKLEPLRADKVIAAIDKATSNPSLMPGNKELQSSLGYIRKELEQWTRDDGVIPAEVLDTLRKNAINSVVNQFAGSAKPKAQRDLAGKVLDHIRPVIIDAIEQAGGTGYRAYLKDYATAMQKLNERKLSAKALDMYKNSPQKFIKLIEGDSPKEIEKVFGPGQYDIAKEVSEGSLNILRDAAAKVSRDIRIDKQAKEGTKALAALVEQNLRIFRMPNVLNRYIAIGNKSLDVVENKLGKGTMDILIKSMKTPQGVKDLLDTLPPAEQSRITRLLSNPNIWSAGTKVVSGNAATAPLNTLAPDQKSQNAY